jgi:protein SCO1/2
VTRCTRYTLPVVAPLVAILVLAVVVVLPLSAQAQPGSGGVVTQHEQPKEKGFRPEAGIEEQIDAQVPLDLTFRDENDQPITFGAAMNGKPTILVPVYYRCPMLCGEILDEVRDAVREMPPSFSVGSQFQIITVSMDPKEHGDLARGKKNYYLHGEGGYGRPGADEGWRFLTGSKESIGTLLDTVGYRFEFDKMLKEYNHPSGIIILSPQGKITRYFHGVTYRGNAFRVNAPEVQGTDGKYTRPTTSLRLSLIEAAEGKGGSLLDKITLLCYRYDHLKQGYSLNVLRVVQLGGIITLLAVAGTALFFVRREGILRVVLARVGVFVLICVAVSGLALGSSLVRSTRSGESTLGAVLLSVSFLATLSVTVIAYRRGRMTRAERPAPIAGQNDTLPAGGTV